MSITSQYILGFFGITFIVLMINLFVAPFILKPQFDFDKWTIKKSVVYIALRFFLISILNWTYNSTIGKEIAEQHSLIFFILFTISVGIIPTFFLIYYIEKKLKGNKQTWFAENQGRVIIY